MAVITYSKPSLDDLKAIHAYISRDSFVNATRFIESIREHIKTLNTYPEIGSLVFPMKFNNLRQLLHKKYRVVYHFFNETVTIITIHHQSRLVENIKGIKEYKE